MLPTMYAIIRAVYNWLASIIRRRALCVINGGHADR